jgi:hypothetical protein
LAITGTRRPTRSITSCTSSTSLGNARRQRDQVHAEIQRELEILDVLLRQGRHRDVHPGQRQALVVADRSALGDRADHVGSIDVRHDQSNLAVVDQQPVPGCRVLVQPLVRGAHPVVVADDVLHRDPHGLAGLPPGGSLGEPSQPDLGTLEIGQDPDGPGRGVEAARTRS